MRDWKWWDLDPNTARCDDCGEIWEMDLAEAEEVDECPECGHESFIYHVSEPVGMTQYRVQTTPMDKDQAEQIRDHILESGVKDRGVELVEVRHDD